MTIHLQVDFLLSFFSQRVRHLISAISAVVAIVFMVVFCIYGVSLIEHATGASTTLPLRMRDIYYSFPIGAVLVICRRGSGHQEFPAVSGKRRGTGRRRGGVTYECRNYHLCRALVLAFLGLPIYLSIGIATLVAMLQAGFPLEAIAQKTFLGMNSASLLCIPLFILAGNIMAQGITQKLIAAANVPLGRVRGSLASVTVLSSALFGAISGSAVATAAAVGGMTVPAMKENGYDKNYAVACASCSSLLGPMIPPSISLVIYASLTECSIQKLFMATAVPAVFCTVCFLAYTLYYGHKIKLPKQPKTTTKEKLMVLKDSIWALSCPLSSLA